MKELIESLKKIEKLIKSTTDEAKILPAIGEAIASAKKEKQTQLESELSIWQGKATTILKDMAGRQGMAKHCGHWIEKLQAGSSKPEDGRKKI